ncbi:MAG: hypothetical protein GY906_37155 [bacterium]|nr:hypothetical protein [bacterium]
MTNKQLNPQSQQKRAGKTKKVTENKGKGGPASPGEAPLDKSTKAAGNKFPSEGTGSGVRASSSGPESKRPPAPPKKL